MSATLSAVFAMLCLAVCANAQTYTLGIHRNPNQHIESTVTSEARHELQRLLGPAGVHVTWQVAGPDKPAQSFERLVVASFDGNCSADELPAIAFAPRTDRLADTVVGKEGRLRPFFRVNCSRLIWTLRPLLDHLSVPGRNIVLGRAIARVMAHEIYHILAEATDHAESGVAKPSLSFEDLVTDRFDFSLSSLNRIRQNVTPADDLINQPGIALNLAN